MLPGKHPAGRPHMILIESRGPASESVCQLFEELYDPALLIDPETGTFVGANGAACEFLGYSAEELAHLSPADIHPHEIPRLDAFLFSVQERAAGSRTICPAGPSAEGCYPPRCGRRWCGSPTVPTCWRSCTIGAMPSWPSWDGRSASSRHDLRNTMVSSRLMSDRLRRHEDPLVRQSAELIARSVDRAVRMCQQTLDVGSAREPSPRRERFTLADLATELNAAIGPAEVARVPLEVPEADAIALDADFDQIFRILMNLIRNALAAGSRHVRLMGSMQDGIIAAFTLTTYANNLARTRIDPEYR
jgi:hypothetical protein